MGTSLVERRVRLADGGFSQSSLRKEKSGREYQNGDDPAAELRFLVNGQDVSAANWRWKLRGDHTTTGAQGELRLDLELESPALRVTKHYVVLSWNCSHSGMLTMQNSSDKPVQVGQLDFLHVRVLAPASQGLQLNYLTGGGIYNGSQLLKTEPVGPGYRRTIDSNRGAQPGAYSGFPATDISA